MKRARSALTLHSIAHSIHQSIQQHTAKTQHQRLANHTQARSTQLLPPNNLTHEQRDNRVFILQKQITSLEREIENSKSTIRNYSKELEDYELTTQHIHRLQEEIKTKHTEIETMHNQLSMLRQEIVSIAFNTEERVAEKQYYQEFLETYRRQYDLQSKLVMEILELQTTNCRLRQETSDLQKTIFQTGQEITQWKNETQFDLNQHKLKNHLKLVRIEMIQHQDKCDLFCQQHNLRKLRELYCMFFKQHAKRNGLTNEEAEIGIDLFVCKQQLVEEFSEFVRERLVYNKPQCQAMQDYLASLVNMEGIFRKSNSQLSKKLLTVQLEQLQQLNFLKKSKEEQLERNQTSIKNLESKIEEQFSQESLAVIEYLREKSNKYDIKEIKSKLKESKRQQHARIQSIKQAHQHLTHLQKALAKEDPTVKTGVIKLSIVQLQNETMVNKCSFDELQQQLSILNKQKDHIQTLINSAISTWRERDQNKLKLQQLYQQLNDTSKFTSYAEQPHSSHSHHFSFKPAHKSKISTFNEFPLAQSMQPKQHSKKESPCSLNQSKSILSLKNPYEKIMKRSIQIYQPILSDCQMILSRRLTCKEESKSINKQEHRQLTLNDLKDMQNYQSNVDMKKAKAFGRQTDKENDLWLGRTKSQAQTQTHTKYSLSVKPSPSPFQTSKGKLSATQRTSLSKLLISKFNR